MSMETNLSNVNLIITPLESEEEEISTTRLVASEDEASSSKATERASVVSCVSSPSKCKVLSGPVNRRAITKHGVTDLQLIDFTFNWEINSFQQCLDRKLLLFTSPVFTADDNDDIAWQLALYPGDHETIDDKYFALHIKVIRKEFKPLKKTVRIIVTLVNATESESMIHEIMLKTIEQNQSERIIERFVDRSVLLDESKGFISPASSFTIVCQLTFGMEIFTYIKRPSSRFSSDANKAASASVYNPNTDFEVLLDIGKFSDAKIRVCDKEISVHRNILSMRSRYFASVFSTDSSPEARVIVMDDIEFDVLKDILLFIYGGEIRDLKNRKSDFLAAAHKYGINGLKTICEEALIDNLGVHNIGEMLVLADCYEAQDLKETAIEFLTQNSHLVINTQPFSSLIKLLSAPMLAEVVTTLMQKGEM